MASEIRLRTGVWHGDEAISLCVPAEWRIATHWPRTPRPLTDAEIAAALERPAGQPPLAELCRGKNRPLVIVDDLNRPTPAARILPAVLRQFARAGIAPAQVTILVATGSHGWPHTDSLMQKIGSEAARCRMLVHDAARQVVKAGRTSFGTPVFVNREVSRSDFVLGIGGVLPNHTAGFGGGSKLAVGVLGIRSISHLHYTHPGVGPGSVGGPNPFRRDLDEIARMIGLHTMITVHVDADREIVRVSCGDHFRYHQAEVEFCRRSFQAPGPGDADVVISNAYPNDLSLTFAQMKGFAPLRRCHPDASRIAIAACSEGLGYHDLYPFLNSRRLHRLRKAYRLLAARGPVGLAGRFLRRMREESRPKPQNRIWLYRPRNFAEPLPADPPGIRVTSSWEEIVAAVAREQSGKREVRVAVYPCAPMQMLGDGPDEESICLTDETSIQATT